ncbi:MAG: hypothetical protein HQL69_06680 [Magnetococcales bacterium]|nr:hypothetical protein [Magnetococcales bacterium]
MGSTVFKTPGPFSRIKAINFAQTSRYSLRFIRDDGVEYTPTLNENITVTLLTPSKETIFQGESQGTANNQTIYYSENVAGLVKKYYYINGRYHIELDNKKMAENYAINLKNIGCYITTKGTNTLSTIFTQSHHNQALIKLFTPGSYTIKVPYWRVTNHSLQPSLQTLEKITTIYSSVSYRAEFAINNGQALAFFMLPILGIVWRPNADLQGWYGSFDIRDVCMTGAIYAPWQHPDGVNQPIATPSNIYDRIYQIHNNVVLKISLTQCNNYWIETGVELSSNFGFSHHIPYIHPGDELVDINYPISDFGKKISGRQFTLICELLWNSTGFTYSTGENPIYSNQTATLLASPAVDFDTITFQPLPE